MEILLSFTSVITITTQPAATTVAEGSITGSLTIAASVAPVVPLTYQWYSNTTNSTAGGTLLTGETNASFAIPTSLTAGTYYYYCEVSAPGATSVNSNVATVTVNTPPPPPPTYPPRITGEETLKLTVGYAATSTGASSISGTPTATDTKISGNDRITWNNTTKRIDIAAGLPVGVYTVKLEAENSVGRYEFTFTLTVAERVYYIDIPASFVGGTVVVQTDDPNPYLSTEGATVTLTVTPDDGYELGSIHVYMTDGSGKTVEIPLSGSGAVFTFKMPSNHVTIVVTFTDMRDVGIENVHAVVLTAYTQNGVLYVNGLQAGATWSVYSITGVLIYQAVAPAERAEFILPARGLYIVRSGNSVIKVSN
jgi:hypothetical protein